MPILWGGSVLQKISNLAGEQNYMPGAHTRLSLYGVWKQDLRLTLGVC